MLVATGFVAWKAYRRLTLIPEETAETEEINQAYLPVRVVEAETGLVQGWVFDEGTVWPVRRRALNFQANGDVTYVAKINGVELREGDLVSRGQLLATIDDRRQRSTIETATADVDVAINQRSQSQASLAQAQANVDKAQSDLALAQTELQRYQGLFDQGAVSESDRDVYQNRVVQAEAALKTAQQDVFSAQDGVNSAEAQIAAAQARLNETSVDLEDTQLVSPIDGIIAYINVREGEYWSTQYLDTSSPQRVIETAPIVVISPQSFEVELEIQADEAGQIRPGQRAYVVLEQEVSAIQAGGASRQDLLELAKQRGSAATVFAVSPSQTPGGRGTKVTIRDFAQVQNLQVGGRAYVWIEVAQKANAVVLPLGALLVRDQDVYAFVFDPQAEDTGQGNLGQGKVQRRRVTQGIEGFSGIEIVSGVQAGEWVVIEGQNRLVDQAPVEAVNWEVIR
jgi:multidrug resistance efflux pump